MAAPHSVDPAQLAEQLASASPDVLREMVTTMANALMSAQADQLCGAEYGERSPQRSNRRNGYRTRDWDTRAGTVELAVPKLRHGSYFPDWLLTHRRRAEQALVTVVATAYLLGVSTRRVEKLAEQLGIKSLSRSQVSEMATHLDAQVAAFRDRPLDAGPYTFCWVDALTVKVREDGRVVNVHALIATAVNADGHREILGLDVASGEDGAGWLAFLRGLVARGLSGVQLIISDAHPGLAIADLESRLGVQLLVRRRAKAATLTEAGLRVLADARRLLEGADDLTNRARAATTEISGILTLGCYSTLAPFVIPPVLDDFTGRHPGLEIRVQEGSADDMLAAVLEGRCELAVLYANDISGDFDSAVIRTTRPYIVLAADHPLARRSQIRLSDVAAEPLIMFDVPSARNAANLLSAGGLEANIRHLSSNIEVVRGLVARGLGYSILVQRWPIDISYEGLPIVAREIADRPPERHVVLAWPRQARPTRRAGALVQFCRETFSNATT